MTQAIAVVSWAESVGCALIALATCAAWVRHRTLEQAWLALAVGLFAAVTVSGRVAQTLGVESILLGRILIVAFLASGYALALFRNSVLPLGRAILGGLFALLVGVSVGLFLVPLPSGLSPAPTVTQWIMVWALVLLWCGCVGEAAVRFWIASLRRPLVQRIRLRALAAGYGSVVVLLVVALGVGIIAPQVTIEPWYQLLVGVIGLATVPMLYVGFVPPRWLRRVWREREEAAMRRGRGDLLLAADLASVAERSLDWALRLVGADRGVLAGPQGQVLARRGVDASQAAELVALTGEPGPGVRRVGTTMGGTALVAPLPIAGSAGQIVVLASPFTPVFAEDEVARLGEYALSAAVALDRIRSQAKFEGLLHAAPDALVGVHPDGTIAFVNRQTEKLFGYTRDELLGRQIEILVPDRAHGIHPHRRAQYFAHPQVRPMGAGLELSARRKDGSEFPAEISLSSLDTEMGLLVTAAVRDVSERKRAERLRAMQFAVTRTLAEARSVDEAAPSILASMATALDWQAAILFLVDPDERRLRSHAGWVEPSLGQRVLEAAAAVTWGFGEGLPGLVWSTGAPVSIDDVTGDPRVRGRVVAEEEGFHGAAGLAIVHEGRVAGVITFGCHERRSLDDDLLTVLADVGSQIGQFVERKRVEEALAASAARLASLAATDALTGLPNRRGFERALEAPQPGGFAILAIDVDNLKVLNDTYGHEAGDAALRAVATALRMGVCEAGAVARTGGDEFAVLLPATDAVEASAAADRLCRSMHGVVLPRGQARISIGCSVGSAGDDPLRCWAMADEALYRAKAGGRDRFELLSDGGEAVGSGLGRWETVLPRLMRPGQIVSVFQPIVDLATRAVLGYEALARPEDFTPEMGVDSLFNAAGRLGVGRDLDWASRRAAVHGARGLPPGSLVFINVGADSLLDPVHGVDQMLLLLRWAGRRPEDVVLEITERDAIRDLDRLVDVLTLYRASGFRFALDDVGEGHSTFEVLAAAMPEYLKVAGSLVRRLEMLGPCSAVEALVTFAAATGAEVIAEGIEAETTAHRLHELGVTLGQGFALARPATPMSFRNPGPVGQGTTVTGVPTGVQA